MGGASAVRADDLRAYESVRSVRVGSIPLAIHLNGMMTMSKTVQRRRMRLICGGVLCSLVFFFSVATKIAMPQPGKEIKPISSLKMQREIPRATLQAAPTIAVSATLFLFAFAESFTVPATAKFSLVIDPQAPVFQCWFSPYLSVRPPPSI